MSARRYQMHSGGAGPRSGRTCVTTRSVGTSGLAGFTLLEVLLAIAISVLVMSIVGTAMFFQLQVVDSSRGEVEQAQLARALMQQIADDLRNVVKYEPQDVSSLMPDASTQDAAAAGGDAAAGTGGTGSSTGGGASTSGGGSSSGGGAGGSGSKTSGGGGTSGGGSKTSSGGSTNSSSQGTSGSPSSSAGGSGATTSSSDGGSSDTAAVEQTPGLRGWPDYLQVDISRLPRRDQLLSPTEGAGGILGRISDVKTVSYYVDDQSSAADGQAGLKRFEIARAESLLSMETGTMATQEQTQSKLLAAEVVAIRFQYSDGEQWYDTWPPETTTDQKSAAKLPMAVHVVLTFRPDNFEEFGDVASWSALDLRGLPQRRLIVHLPAAVPASEQQDSGSESGTQQNITSSGTSGTAAQSGSGTQGTKQ